MSFLAAALLVTLGTAGPCDRPAPSAADTVPVTVLNNHVYVPVCVAGTTQTFILDTGAGQSFIDFHLIDSLHLEVASQTRITGAGAGSTAGAQLASPFEVSVAAVRVNVRSGLRMAGIAASEWPGLGGMLGQDFIAQCVLEIDYHNSWLVLHDRDSFRYQGHSAKVPLHLVNGFPEFTAELELKDGGRVKVVCIADVGSGGALAITKPVVDDNHLLTRVGQTIYRMSGRGAGGPVMATQGRVAALRVGSSEVTNVVTGLHGANSGVFATSNAFQANIGGDILRRFTVTFDYGRLEMMWDANPDIAEPFEADMSGMAFRMDSTETGFFVADVMQGSPADQAGLVLGDLITKVDDRSAVDVGMAPLRKRLKQDGETVSFTVKRDGAERVVKVVTKRMV